LDHALIDGNQETLSYPLRFRWTLSL